MYISEASSCGNQTFWWSLKKKKKFSTGVFSFFVFWESELACHLADTYVGLTWDKAVGFLTQSCWLLVNTMHLIKSPLKKRDHWRGISQIITAPHVEYVIYQGNKKQNKTPKHDLILTLHICLALFYILDVTRNSSVFIPEQQNVNVNISTSKKEWHAFSPKIKMLSFSGVYWQP